MFAHAQASVSVFISVRAWILDVVDARSPKMLCDEGAGRDLLAFVCVREVLGF